MRAGGGRWIGWLGGTGLGGETARLSDATMLYYLSVVYKLYDLMMDVNLHAKLLLL